MNERCDTWLHLSRRADIMLHYSHHRPTGNYTHQWPLLLHRFLLCILKSWLMHMWYTLISLQITMTWYVGLHHSQAYAYAWLYSRTHCYTQYTSLLYVSSAMEAMNQTGTHCQRQHGNITQSLPPPAVCDCIARLTIYSTRLPCNYSHIGASFVFRFLAIAFIAVVTPPHGKIKVHCDILVH